ncbi:hypothetical protein [Streptococcus dysgalactiae]|uniref:Uncharacterized protein n=1 Tax=Streptococcus dysgalactiae subsp. dysgalactiae TaxID=99822 RepID=A0A9X7S031_STRDY|nr:hypothetical protein [Streptococcus dysgalactiae]QGH02922.1 hypothetical protein EA457_10490 [Streptococcus dysgalactiae subsp. dysgalactiae]
METLKEINAHLDKLIAEDIKVITNAENELQKVNERIQKAKDQMASAEESMNEKEYVKAKSDLATATNAKEMYIKRVDKVSNKPLITVDEYKKLNSKLQALEDGRQEEFKSKVKKLMNQIEEVCSEARESINETNEVMEKLANDVLKPTGLDQNKKELFGVYSYWDRKNGAEIRYFYNAILSNTWLMKEEVK